LKFKLLQVIYFCLIFCGLCQCLLFPGIIWNFLFPTVPLLLLLFPFFANLKSQSKLFKSFYILLIGLSLIEIGFHVKSHLNISSPIASQELKVMTYNVNYKNDTPLESIAIINDSNPDILCLQELNQNWHSLLVKHISNEYPYYEFKTAPPLSHGIGIFSKYPISNSNTLYDEFKRPIMQKADVQINETRIQVCNIHLASPVIALRNKNRFLKYYLFNYRQRQEQMKRIQEELDATYRYDDTQLWLGDFNSLRCEPIFKRLLINWQNASSPSLNLNSQTWSNTSDLGPLFTIDYILGRGKLKFVKTRAVRGGSSDHLAVECNLKIPL